MGGGPAALRFAWWYADAWSVTPGALNAKANADAGPPALASFSGGGLRAIWAEAGRIVSRTLESVDASRWRVAWTDSGGRVSYRVLNR